MRVPLSWLAEFVSWSGSAADLAERLTMAGFPVEGITEVGRLDPRIRVGRLLAVEPHPDADRLHVCRVDVASAAPAVVVSGAPGLAAGQLVPVAFPGAHLPRGEEVQTVELRGVRSAGALCSEAELGLSDDASRVCLLPEDAVPGRSLVELPGIVDVVLEIEVTPNRGDCLSMLGVAREVAALTGNRLRQRRVRPREAGTPAAEQLRVRVDAPDLCPRYDARLVRGVRPVTSPLWLRLRLGRAGMRAVGAVVDATNYVMLERGQPLHAFDAEHLSGGEIIVRRARAGERIVTLDGVERSLEAADLVIADLRGPVAIAGVMGGGHSEVTPDTRALLLESAVFAPSAVRRTSRRLGIASQAAYRFERRVDPAATVDALDAVAALIARLAGGRVAPGVVEAAAGLADLAPPTISLRPRRAVSILGTTLTRGEITRRLRALGARCGTGGGTIAVTPPSYRGDLLQEEDLIEEIARVGGYEAIPITLPEAPITHGADTPTRTFVQRVRTLLAGEGLAEMVTVSLTDEVTNERLPGFVGRGLAPIALRNPLSSESSVLRRSPLAGLLRALRLNLDRGAEFVGAFELGKGYGRDADGRACEPQAIAILLHGVWPPCGAERSGPTVDFLHLKGIVSNLLATLGMGDERVAWQPAGEVGFLHPGKSALVVLDGEAVGVAGALHPEIVQACDITGEVWLAELDLARLAHYVPRRVAPRPLPRFPAVTRDIAVIVDEGFRAGEIIEEVRALRDVDIESVRLFDCYRGTPVPSGKKSLAYTIAYRAPDRTLTDDEVNARHAAVLERLNHRFQLELRR
ncbi:MAG TPA: phenylalanine--tRNA ligase subunit beta [Candidatus Nitrosopolaris sp.]|nr:phenylalanine--tRNA ligase subunit beta [Candidatus Nitrosopolaris sp.]